MTANDYYQQGNEYRRQGDWQKAMNCYLEAIALDGDSPAVEAKAMLKYYIIMSKIKGAIVVNTDRCKGCQLCIVACPKNVIALAQKKVNVHGYPYVEAVNPDDCIGCASCGVVCPDGCITVYKKKMEE